MADTEVVQNGHSHELNNEMSPNSDGLSTPNADQPEKINALKDTSGMKQDHLTSAVNGESENPKSSVEDQVSSNHVENTSEKLSNGEVSKVEEVDSPKGTPEEMNPEGSTNELPKQEDPEDNSSSPDQGDEGEPKPTGQPGNEIPEANEKGSDKPTNEKPNEQNGENANPNEESENSSTSGQMEMRDPDHAPSVNDDPQNSNQQVSGAPRTASPLGAELHSIPECEENKQSQSYDKCEVTGMPENVNPDGTDAIQTPKSVVEGGNDKQNNHVVIAAENKNTSSPEENHEGDENAEHHSSPAAGPSKLEASIKQEKKKQKVGDTVGIECGCCSLM